MTAVEMVYLVIERDDCDEVSMDSVHKTIESARARRDVMVADYGYEDGDIWGVSIEGKPLYG